MAFLLNDASISSRFRSFSSSQNSSDALLQARRGFHVEPGTREKPDVAMKSMSKLR